MLDLLAHLNLMCNKYKCAKFTIDFENLVKKKKIRRKFSKKELEKLEERISFRDMDLYFEIFWKY